MTLAFELAAPRRVMFGHGRTQDAGIAAQHFGSRGIVFTGYNPVRCNNLVASLSRAKFKTVTFTTRGEPTFDGIRDFTRDAAGFKPDVIFAMGGGSVIDTAKAVAMLLTNGGDPLDYAEVIGPGKPINKPSLPVVAIPTTAGAGAEATRNAVLIDRETKSKVSLRSHLMLPDLVIIDPQTTYSLPRDVTAATGMDAMAQLIEPFVSVKANPLTDSICRAGIARAARSLERACTHPNDATAREDMALAAWWSGMALANAGLGAVHGFAAAIGGMTNASHGLICARFLAPVCRANIDALLRDNPSHPTLLKYVEIGSLLTGAQSGDPLHTVTWIKELSERLPLGRLRDHGLDTIDKAEVINAAKKSSSMKGNPIALSDDVLECVLEAAISG